MGKLKIMWSIFRSEKMTRLYMSFFVLLIIITSNISINLLKEEYNLKKIGEKCDFENAVYFAKAQNVFSYGEENNQYTERVKSLLEKMEAGGQEIGKITYLYTYLEPFEENGFLLNYNEAITEHVELPLSGGNWFTQGSCNEAILSYDYKNKYHIGDTIEMDVNESDGSRQNITVKVIGFLDKNNYAMNFTVSGYVDISSLIDKNKSAVITSNLYTKDGDKCVFQDNAGIMLFNMPEVYLEQLTEFGSVTSMKEITEIYTENANEKFQEQVGIEVVLLILAISGLGSMNFISMYTKRREYGVYFICGMPRRTTVWMTVFINTFVVGIALIPIILMNFIKPEWFVDIDVFNVLITLGIIVFILAVTFIPFYIIMKKDSIVDLTRR